MILFFLCKNGVCHGCLTEGRCIRTDLVFIRNVSAFCNSILSFFGGSHDLQICLSFMFWKFCRVFSCVFLSMVFFIISNIQHYTMSHRIADSAHTHTYFTSVTCGTIFLWVCFSVPAKTWQRTESLHMTISYIVFSWPFIVAINSWLPLWLLARLQDRRGDDPKNWKEWCSHVLSYPGKSIQQNVCLINLALLQKLILCLWI